MKITITIEHKGQKFGGGHEFKYDELKNPKLVSAIMKGLVKSTLHKMAANFEVYSEECPEPRK